jgi:hypothetical protein
MAGHRVSVRACTLGAFSVLCLGVVSPAEAVVTAPGYLAGPKVAGGSLLWQGGEGVYLSAHAGTRLLVRDAELSAVHVEDGWVVVTEASGARAGRIGQRLSVVRGLRRCPPLRGHGGEELGTVADTLETVANGNIYAVVRASCLSRSPRNAQFLVCVRVGTEHLHVIGRVPSGAISLAAAGSRVALAYTLSSGRVRVEVVDSRDAQLLYRLAPPRGESGRVDRHAQIDGKGNVLVTSSDFFAHFGGGEAFGWWGTPRTRVGRPLDNGALHASLSEGRIAYVAGAGRSIDVLNLATGKARTIVTFSGSVSPEGLGLSNGVLAWAQQRYAYQLATVEGCVGLFTVGPAELTATPLSATGLPIAVEANPGTPPAGRSCPAPP